MSASAGHPQKTPLGVDELRRRTRGLSQRHRTMLLLVNGQRSRREVLALAAQAGVGVEFFHELVAMGLVDAHIKVAAPAAAAAAPVAAPAGADAAATGTTTGPDTLPPPSWADAASTLRVRLEPVLAPPPAEDVSTSIEAVPAAAEPKRIEPAFDDRIERAIAQALSKSEAGDADKPPGPMPATTPRSEIIEPPPARPKRAVPTLDDAVAESQTRPMTIDEPRVAKPNRPSAKAISAAAEPELTTTARMRFSGVAQKPPKPASRRHAAAAKREEKRGEPQLTPAERPAKPARMKMPAAAGALDGDAEERLLAEVRSLLIGTLLVDGPVTSSLTALRVRKANTRFDLTALVWEIERTLVRAKRPREAQARLGKARDLLGLGNTVVDEETSPGFMRTLPPPK